MNYTIKLKEQSLMTYDVIQNKYGEYEIINETIVTSNKQLLPKGLGQGVLKWLSSRVLPKNRQNVKDILSSLNLTWNPIDIISVSYGLSLTDAYWVCPTDSKLAFKDVNLFENDFSEVLSVVAFTGQHSGVDRFKTSPELSTDGMLPKCWRKVDGVISLYKGGTSGASNTGLEPYSEYYSYQVAQAMGLTAVPYDLIKYKGKLVSVCPLFTSLSEFYIPMHQLIEFKSIADVIKIYGEQPFSDLLAFDYIIANTDRHLGNFGMIQNDKGELIKPAPIFDNGLGLFPYLLEEDFFTGAEKSMYANMHPLTDNVPKLLNHIITKETKSKVRKLINFKFQHHPLYSLPEWRITQLESFIAKRVQEVLRM